MVQSWHSYSPCWLPKENGPIWDPLPPSFVNLTLKLKYEKSFVNSYLKLKCSHTQKTKSKTKTKQKKQQNPRQFELYQYYYSCKYHGTEVFPSSIKPNIKNVYLMQHWMSSECRPWRMSARWRRKKKYSWW